MRALVEAMRNDDAAHVAAVVSNNADAGGITWAKGQGIDTVVVDHRPFKGDRAAFEDALSAALAPYALDLICLAGFMRVLTERFVGGWQGRMLNIHPSLLPKYKGLHTHQRALDAGDAVHGCTVHEVTPLLDDGPMLGQAEVPVLAGDTANDLAARVLVQEHRLYPAVLTQFIRGNKTMVHLR
ncbi:Phosphoribosylglycinamide formyltransferase [Ascidiaceihabitans donghaensis]|uniref:Phosphoribosylglycinamide formyltransferase n=2 Tax=Ascidiaceihabitans donghaensis TaxID=1510460 RepID=A0A2R8BDF6_9RHOB|nr:Phosphoribosylglycinamide formyltransferase [Ascidiaceihabitans donghaensis]